MPKPKLTFWCPSCKGKSVVGLNAAILPVKDCVDGRRFICHNCENLFNMDELEAYGNNMSRVYRQQKNNLKLFSPRVEAGLNEW